MFNLHSEMTPFHNDHVRLTDAQRKELEDHRTANRRRLEAGLARLKHPAVYRYVEQGSFEMKTVNQHAEGDYDLDDGASFMQTDLVKKDGTAMTPLEVRVMVRDAVYDSKFNRDPEVRPNCVRVFYEGGYHIDIPVYRIPNPAFPDTIELASGDRWREAKPKEVTTWFKDANKAKSPDTNNGGQFRRAVRLFKFFSRSRKAWRLPSGLAISKLSDEQYAKIDQRDDEILVNLFKSVNARLAYDLTVNHPVLNEKITQGPADQKMVDLHARLGEAVEKLRILSDSACTRLQALQAWKWVFNHSYWDGLIEEEQQKLDKSEAENRSTLALAILQRNRVPAEPVRKGGSNGFG